MTTANSPSQSIFLSGTWLARILSRWPITGPIDDVRKQYGFEFSRVVYGEPGRRMSVISLLWAL